MLTRISTWVLCVGTVLAAAPAQGQVRRPDEALRDLQVVLQIVTAFFEAVDIDNPAELALFNARFGRNDPFSMFDRDRNGRFSHDGGAADLDLAILQFNHDVVDLDNDQVVGFVELECVYAAGHSALQPDDPTTDGVTPDANRDCDGDQMSNIYEISTGLDPLDPADAALDPDRDHLTNRQEAIAGTDPHNSDSDRDGVFDDIEVGGDPDHPADTDGDAHIDALDTDSDGDGVLDGVDNCRLLPNPDQANGDDDLFGDVCDRNIGQAPAGHQGRIFLREAQNLRDSPFPDPLLMDMQVYFREYRVFPTAAVASEVLGACARFAARDIGTAGAFDPVDAGEILVTGTVTDLTFTYDGAFGEYSSDPAPFDLFDLWEAGETLRFTGSGTPRVGAFAHNVEAPQNVEGVSPDLSGRIDRAGTTINWLPGDGNSIRVTLRAGGWDERVICSADDPTGRLDLAAAVLAWVPAQIVALDLEVTRVRTGAFTTDAPFHRGVVTIERALTFEGIALE